MTSFLTSLYSWASWLFTFGWEPVWFGNFWKSSDFVIRWFVFQTAWNCFDNLKEDWAGNLESSLPVETQAQGSGVKKNKKLWTELSCISPRACGTNVSPFCFWFLSFLLCCCGAPCWVPLYLTPVWRLEWKDWDRRALKSRGLKQLFSNTREGRKREAATAVGDRESFV